MSAMFVWDTEELYPDPFSAWDTLNFFPTQAALIAFFKTGLWIFVTINIYVHNIQ